MIPTAEERLHFLQDMQLLLDEGSYSSTYKYALLLALSDLAVERGDVGGAELLIGADEIAGRFIEYYWRQTAPYPALGGSSKVLLQNKGRQAAIAENVKQMQKEAGGSIARARSETTHWQKLVKSVAQTVQVMPLWKLQRVRSGVRDFLYENVGRGNSITLRPGVAFCLREFHGQIQNMVQGAWAREIRGMKQNAPIMGETADLHEFLFGSERASLSVYVPLLRHLQEDHCFYCKQALRSRGEVDHFVPWARYPPGPGAQFRAGTPAV
ncbi:MAG: HNH endonuclease [Candidatus Latescibacterota bacterium]